MTVLNIPQTDSPDAKLAEPEEIIQRTQVFKGEFSPSGIESARCYRRFYFTKILGLKPKTTPAALIYGIAIHKAVETFYNLTDTMEDKVELKMRVVKEFVASWSKAGILGDSKRNLEAGIVTMGWYCDYYGDDTSSFTAEDIETDQWMVMPNGTMLLVKMDRVLNRGGQIILVDTKTTSAGITDWFFKNFENHLPTTLYYYVIEKLLGRCDSVIIDAIKVPPPAPTSKSAPFGRQTFLRTELQVQDALSTYVATTDYIMSILRKPEEEWATRFYCNQGECDKYGGCQFLPVCKYGLDHPSVMVDFDIDTPKREIKGEE